MNASEALKKYEVTIESEFVPWSQSRNKDKKDPSLNWKVTLTVKGRKIFTTDYMAGLGHCPSYEQGRMTLWLHESLTYECEKGYPVKRRGNFGIIPDKKNPILPSPEDVVYSLLMDADVLNYTSFEEWAGDFGYDEDSRKAEAVYQACMKIALPFRNAFSDTALDELSEAFQDY